MMFVQREMEFYMAVFSAFVYGGGERERER